MDGDSEESVFYRAPMGPVLSASERGRMAVHPDRILEGQEERATESNNQEKLDNIPRLQPRLKIPMEGQQPTCVRFSMDGSLLAVSHSGGGAEVFRSADGSHAHALVRQLVIEKRPCTSLRFRPASSADLTRNVLVVADSYGELRWWHATSGKALSVVAEPDNQVYTIDYQPSGALLASSGLDFKVRVYDETTRKLLHTLSDGDGQTTAGHSNRVFAVKWHSQDPHVLLSAGWDNTIQLWDIRMGLSFRSVFGSNVCGEALDVRDDKILTGSWRVRDQLQFWDYGSGELLQTVKWHEVVKGREGMKIYSAQYGRGACHNLMAAGGSGTNEARVLHAASGETLGIFQATSAVYSVAFSPLDTELAIATQDAIYIAKVDGLAEHAERVSFSV